MPGLDNQERAIQGSPEQVLKWNKNPFDKRVGREVTTGCTKRNDEESSRDQSLGAN
ncbi:MAG: hypothetical protein ACLVBB_05575 [Dysosmobacter welbionis]